MRRLLITFTLLICLGASANLAQEGKPTSADKDAKQDEKNPEAKKPEAKKPSLPFLIYYPGSRFYSEGSKGDAIWSLGDYFGEKLRKKGVNFLGECANSKTSGVTLIMREKPAFALVSAAFYADHATTFSLRAIAGAKQGEALGETWVLVAPKTTKKLADLKNESIHSIRANDEADYLRAVVLEGQLECTFTASTNTSDTLSAMKTAKANAPKALLMRERFLSDKDLESKANPLHRLWTSKVLSPMVVVAFGKRVNAVDEKKLHEVLLGMAKDKNAKEHLTTLGVSAFVDANSIQLDNEKRKVALMRLRREAKKREAASKKKAAPAKE